MSHSQAAGLVWVTVSQQDCCELQSGCQIVTGYSQAAGLAWVTVQLQDCFLGYNSAAGFSWVMVKLQDCCELHSVANIQAAGLL